MLLLGLVLPPAPARPRSGTRCAVGGT